MNGPYHQYSYAGGVTGIQYGHPDECDRVRLKLRWEPVGEPAVTDYFESGLSGVNSGPQYGAEYLYWTDHDVKRGGLWSGFRLYH